MRQESELVRLLVVDDDVRDRAHLVRASRKVVRPPGGVIHEADTLESALELIVNDDYDIIITDVRLKEDDKDNTEGLEVIRVAKEKNRETQVIGVTNWYNSNLAAQVMLAGADDFIDRADPSFNVQTDIPSKIRKYLNIHHNSGNSLK